MKRYLLFLLFALFGATQMFSQTTLQEFVIEKDTPPDVTEIFKEYGCTPEDGIIVYNTTIPDLEFSIPDAPNRLRHVSSFDETNKRYVLCVQPTDGLGGYTKYIVLVNSKSYKPEAQIVSAIKPGLAQYYSINPKVDLDKKINELVEKKFAQMEGKSQQSVVSTQNQATYQPQQQPMTKGRLTVSTNALYFNGIGENKLIEVLTYTNKYKVRFLPKWIKTSQYANNLQISCDRNKKDKPRKGYFFIVSGREKVMINVVQAGKNQQNNVLTSNQIAQTVENKTQEQLPIRKGTSLTVSVNELVFTSEREIKLIEVTTKAKDYKVSDFPRWLRARKSGKNLRISCIGVTKDIPRKGTFNIVSGREKVQISVVQEPVNKQSKIIAENQSQTQQTKTNVEQSQSQLTIGEDNSKEPSAQYWIQEGVKNNNAGNYEEAIHCCNNALDINPNTGDAWYNMGIAYGREKNNSKASECYQKAAQLGNKDAQKVLAFMGKKWKW